MRFTMTPKVAKMLVRAIGTLAAAVGGLALSIQLLLGDLFVRNVILIISNLLILLIAVWLLWIGYVVWFRLSPLGIQQAFGAVGASTILVPMVLTPLDDRHNAAWYFLAFVIWFAFVVAAYPLVSRYVIRILFPEKPVAPVPPENSIR